MDETKKIERIRRLVGEIERSEIPNATIEYSFSLPEDGNHITPNRFYGVKARYNKNVPSSIGASVIYKLN